MYWVPKRLLVLEARAIAKILKAPYYTFGEDGPFQLKNQGLISFRSILAINYAAMFRASRTTLKGWEASWSKLFCFLKELSIHDSPSSSLSPPVWDSLPIVSRLFGAFNGFRDNYLDQIPP